MKYLWKSMAIALLLALLAGLTAATAETFYPRQVDYCNEYVTLRAKPSSSARELDRVYYGEVVMAAPYNSEFSYCCFNGQYGYIKSQYLSPDVHGYSDGDFRVANCESWISLRSMPTTDAKVLARVPLGTIFDDIYYVDGGYDPDAFAYVRYQNQFGWVLWRYLEYVSYPGGQ